MNYTVKLPKVGTVIADDIPDLVARVREAIDSNGYGASDVGGRWTVKQGRAKVGTLSYNGNFIAA